jgi:ABC-type multidrug transport system fused ATPase/permease subunit
VKVRPDARPERAFVADVLRRHIRAAVTGCVASTIHQICEALVPVAIGLAIDLAVNKAGPTAIVLAVAAVLAVFAVLGAGGAIAAWTLNATCLREAHDLRVRATGHTLADPIPGASRGAGELLNILTADTKATAEVLRIIAHLVSGCAGLLKERSAASEISPPMGYSMILRFRVRRRRHHANRVAPLRPVRPITGVRPPAARAARPGRPQPGPMPSPPGY